MIKVLACPLLNEGNIRPLTRAKTEEFILTTFSTTRRELIRRV
jgi:hypothetical protein